jgi:hypothetical protein
VNSRGSSVRSNAARHRAIPSVSPATAHLLRAIDTQYRHAYSHYQHAHSRIIGTFNRIIGTFNRIIGTFQRIIGTLARILGTLIALE